MLLFMVAYTCSSLNDASHVCIEIAVSISFVVTLSFTLVVTVPHARSLLYKNSTIYISCSAGGRYTYIVYVEVYMGYSM